jgi:N-methylhydantoinase B
LFDSDGVDLNQPVPLKVKIEVAGSEMIIDFSEISDQVPGSINSGESGAVAAARGRFQIAGQSVFTYRRGLFPPLEDCHSSGKDSQRHAAGAGGELEPHLAHGH